MTTERDEADVLNPDEMVRVGGKSVKVAHVPTKRRDVEVREFTFGQAMKVEALAAPIIAAMGEAVEAERDAIDWGKVMAAISRFPERFTELLSVATGMEPEELEALPDRDGRLLVVTFMKVNWDFFIDRLVERKGTTITDSDRVEIIKDVMKATGLTEDQVLEKVAEIQAAKTQSGTSPQG